MPNVEHILLDVLGRQHVTLRSATAVLQLTIQGAPATIGPVALGIRIRDTGEVAIAADHLSRLQSLLSAPRTFPNTPPRWTVRTSKLRDALIALDGRRAGATNRQIAAVIYGHDWIEQDWPNAGLQDRLRRDLQRGLALSNSGYRDLLA